MIMNTRVVLITRVFLIFIIFGETDSFGTNSFNSGNIGIRAGTTIDTDEITLTGIQSDSIIVLSSNKEENDIYEPVDNGQFSATSPKKTFIWEVKSYTTTAYILGSCHVADESFYPLPAAIQKSFQNADVLAVETNILDIYR